MVKEGKRSKGHGGEESDMNGEQRREKKMRGNRKGNKRGTSTKNGVLEELGKGKE